MYVWVNNPHTWNQNNSHHHNDTTKTCAYRSEHGLLFMPGDAHLFVWKVCCSLLRYLRYHVTETHPNASFYWHGLILIPSWIRNYTSMEVWSGISNGNKFHRINIHSVQNTSLGNIGVAAVRKSIRKKRKISSAEIEILVHMIQVMNISIHMSTSLTCVLNLMVGW